MGEASMLGQVFREKEFFFRHFRCSDLWSALESKRRFALLSRVCKDLQKEFRQTRISTWVEGSFFEISDKLVREYIRALVDSRTGQFLEGYLDYPRLVVYRRLVYPAPGHYRDARNIWNWRTPRERENLLWWASYENPVLEQLVFEKGASLLCTFDELPFGVRRALIREIVAAIDWFAEG